VAVDVLNIKGQQTVSFLVDGRELHTFLVYSILTDAAGLLGTEILKDEGALIVCGCGKMSFTYIAKAPRACNFSPTRCVSLQGKEGHSPNAVYGRRGINTSSSQPASPRGDYCPE